MENTTNYERELAYTNTDSNEENLVYRSSISYNHFGVGSGLSYNSNESNDLEWF